MNIFELDQSLRKQKSIEEGHGRYWCSTDKKWKERQGPKQTRKTESKNSGASKEQETEFHTKLDKLVHKTFGKRKDEDLETNEEKQRLDPKCWTGYRKAGTKMKGGVRVNNCVKVEDQDLAEGVETTSTLDSVFNEHDFYRLEHIWPALEAGDKKEALRQINHYLNKGKNRAWWGDLQALDINIDPNDVENSQVLWSKPIQQGVAEGMSDRQWFNNYASWKAAASKLAADDDGQDYVKLDGKLIAHWRGNDGWIDRSSQGVAEGWQEEAEEMSKWAEYVRTKLLNTPKQQRWAVAKQLSQLEVKHFGSQLVQFKKYDNKTGQPIAGNASESHFTQIVQDTLRALNTKPVTGGVALDQEPSEIHKPDDRGGKDWVVDTKMGWLVVPNAGQAPGRVKRLLWKAFNAGPEIYPLALDIWEETGDFTEQDYKDCIIKAARLRNSGGLEAQAYRDYAGEGMAEGSELDKFKNKSGKFPEPRERRPGQVPSKSETVGKDGKIYHWQDPRAKQGVAEGFKNTYSVGDRVNGPLGTGTIVAVSKNVNVDGKVKVKLDDPSRAGEDGKYKDSFVLDTTQLKHISEQGVAEAIPYALSAANAAAEYRRQGQAGGGYRGRIDMPVESDEDYILAGRALKRAARAAGEKIEYGKVGNMMSVFSDSMNSDELDQFIDRALGHGVTESNKEADYGPEYQDMVRRVGQRAKQGPMKTVWDPVKRVYKNVPVKDKQVKETGNSISLTMTDGSTRFVRSGLAATGAVKSILNYLVRSRDFETLKNLKAIDGHDVSGIISKIFKPSNTIDLGEALDTEFQNFLKQAKHRYPDSKDETEAFMRFVHAELEKEGRIDRNQAQDINQLENKIDNLINDIAKISNASLGL